MRRWCAAATAVPRIRPSIHHRRCLHQSLVKCDNNSSRSGRSPTIASLLADQERNAPSSSSSSSKQPNVTVHGWIKSVRKQKKVAFAVVNDGLSLDSLQAVLAPTDASSLTIGAAVELSGLLKASTGSGQKWELQVDKVRLLGNNDPESNPLQPKYQTPEFLRTIPHLRPRIPSNALLLRMRSQLIRSVTNSFGDSDWVQCHTPVITSSDCEGAGEVFTVSSNASQISEQSQPLEKDGSAEPFFRTPKYLTVSAQLHLEALAQAVSRVWTLSPTFRAEKSDTARHLSEFYMLEAEMCFVDDMEDVMKVVEFLLKDMVSELSASRVGHELLQLYPPHPATMDKDADVEFTQQDLQQRWTGIVGEPAPEADMADEDHEHSLSSVKPHRWTISWPRITYIEAIAILKEAQARGTADFVFQPTYQDGLQAEHERFLATAVGKGSPVFVTDYPRHQKPFYMAPSSTTANSRGVEDTVACFDLLVPDLGELVGGSMRKDSLIENLPGESLQWYQDLRKYGSVPHGGFGLGFDRLLCYLSGVNNIRDIVAFPRWHGRCDC